MDKLNVTYGYCKDTLKSSIYDELMRSNSVLRIKTIGHIGTVAIFAALIYKQQQPHCCRQCEDVHFVHTIPKKTIIHEPKKTKAQKKKDKLKKSETALLLASLQGTSIKKGTPVKKIKLKHLNDENQIAVFKKLKRRFRKHKNLQLTEKNWRQHINKKPAIDIISNLITHSPKQGAFPARGETPFSTSH